MTRQLEICNIDLSHNKFQLGVSITLESTDTKEDLMITTESFVCKDNDLSDLLKTVVYATLGGVLDILNRMPPSIRLLQVQTFIANGAPWVSVLVEVDGARPKIRFGMVKISVAKNLMADIALAAATATLSAIEKDISSYLNTPIEILDIGKKQRLRRWWRRIAEKACL
jgi:hypothetical protein